MRWASSGHAESTGVVGYFIAATPRESFTVYQSWKFKEGGYVRSYSTSYMTSRDGARQVAWMGAGVPGCMLCDQVRLVDWASRRPSLFPTLPGASHVVRQLHVFCFVSGLPDHLPLPHHFLDLSQASVSRHRESGEERGESGEWRVERSAVASRFLFSAPLSFPFPLPFFPFFPFPPFPFGVGASITYTASAKNSLHLIRARLPPSSRHVICSRSRSSEVLPRHASEHYGGFWRDELRHLYDQCGWRRSFLSRTGQIRLQRGWGGWLRQA